MVRRTIQQLTPHVALVMGTTFILGLTLYLVISLVGGYLIARSVVANQRAAEVAAAKGECRSLLALDNARLTANPSTPYSKALAQGIHQVYENSQCNAILSGRFH